MSLADALKDVKVGVPRKEALWQGPESNDELGGVTFSMLSRFLVCRERFRIHYVEGLRPNRQFNHKIEYGHMWHTCEEAYATKPGAWEEPLTKYCQGIVKQYPLAQEQIDHWYRVCKVQFPLYIKHWLLHQETSKQVPVFQEQVFDVSYTLPSGRVVRLRGKWDSIHLLGDFLWLMENKSKGDIDIPQIQRQLTFDLQTMMYLVAMEADREEIANYLDANKVLTKKAWKLGGVRYNVIRRPLSGGKGTIVRHKASKNKPEETKDAFYSRLAEYIIEEPDHYFTRWNTEISPAELQLFRNECLDPILENLCHWYDHISGACEPNEATHGIPPSHWRHPFGVYNVLDEGGSSDVDGYLLNKSEVGLERVDTLFEELQE